MCVITNNPARYKDPKTGLPFASMSAFKQLRRLYHGEYNWSRLLGAWVGSDKQAALGVPERFLNAQGGRSEDGPATSGAQATANQDKTQLLQQQQTAADGQPAAAHSIQDTSVQPQAGSAVSAK